MSRTFRLLALGLLVVASYSVAVSAASATSNVLPTSEITLDPGATSAYPGQQLMLTGTLSFQDAAPAGGLTVDVTETRPDSSVVDLGPLTTASDGSYSVQTEPLTQVGGNGYTFTATYAGDAGHQPSHFIAALFDEKRTSSIINFVPLPSGPSLFQTTTLSGVVNDLEGQVPQGTPVTITETRPNGTQTTVGTPATDIGGNFQATTEILNEGGKYTFSAHYPGSSVDTTATATTSVTIAKVKTTITLAMSATTIHYGAGVNLTAHLNNAPAGTMVSIMRNVAGVKSLVSRAAINSSQNLVRLVHPNQNTSYYATFAGNIQRIASTSTSHAVTVIPILHGLISRGYGLSGNYHLYHYHKECQTSAADCPFYTISFSPSNPGHYVYAAIQQYYHGGWVNSTAFRGTLGPKSEATIKIRYDSSVIGLSFRVAGVFLKGTKFGQAVTGFTYFRITR